MVEADDFRNEQDQLRRQWLAMPAAERSATWEKFTQDIDEGSAGWSRYHPILWPAYEQGVDMLTNVSS